MDGVFFPPLPGFVGDKGIDMHEQGIADGPRTAGALVKVGHGHVRPRIIAIPSKLGEGDGQIVNRPNPDAQNLVKQVH